MVWDFLPRSRLAIGEVEKEEEPETRRELLRSMMSLAEQPSSLDDERVLQVLTMAKGELPVDVIITKFNDITSFPEPSGSDLVALKDAKVPGRATRAKSDVVCTPQGLRTF